MDAAFHHHEQLLLQHDIEGALQRAERGEADTNDWRLIYWACGIGSVRYVDHTPDLFNGESNGTIRN